MPKAVITVVFKVLRNASVHTLHVPKALLTFMFKVLRHGLRRYILYTLCDNVRVQSATEWTASLHTLITHAQSCDNVGVQRATEWSASVHTLITHAQSCDYVHVQYATEWTASVHTLHMPNAVITFVFKVLRDGLLGYIFFTYPKL